MPRIKTKASPVHRAIMRWARQQKVPFTSVEMMNNITLKSGKLVKDYTGSVNYFTLYTFMKRTEGFEIEQERVNNTPATWTYTEEAEKWWAE